MGGTTVNFKYEALRKQKIPLSFYQRKEVTVIARELLGKILVTHFDGIFTAARITETEAYNGAADKASHAYQNRRTQRTETMFAPGGTAYVYLCYGIHHLFNVVTNKQEIPHAVLIRSAAPLAGIEEMLLRTLKAKADSTLTKGPGNVSRALGIRTAHSGVNLLGDELFIADDGYRLRPSEVLATRRIGVDYAGVDALLPYRFIVKDSPFISGKKMINNPKI